MTTDRESAVRVLVVDDVPANCEVLALILKAEGMLALKADSGAAAFERLQEDRPDLVLLDVRLPDMSGFEICRRLKSDSRTAGIPVVMVTALDDDEERRQGTEVGADDFLTKPLDRARLVETVHRLLHGAAHRPDEALMRSASRTRHTAVMLLANLRGSARLADKARPEATVDMLSRWTEILVDTAREHGGTPYDIAGDRLTVAFGLDDGPNGAPIRAATCAQHMIQRSAPIVHNGWWELGVDLGLAIGLHRGEVLVAELGGRTARTRTLIGEAVQSARRLAGRARAGEILMSSDVMEVLGDCDVAKLARVVPAGPPRAQRLPTRVFCVTVSARVGHRQEGRGSARH